MGFNPTAPNTAAKAGFKTWEDYIVSILIGRAVAFRFDDVVVGAADHILEDGKALLKKHPVSKY